VDSGRRVLDGREATLPDAHPVHRVYVDGFWMDRTEVTNAAFARFVRATHYRTVAERGLRPETLRRRAARQARRGLGRVHPSAVQFLSTATNRWWSYVVRASWRHPAGSAADLDGHDRLSAGRAGRV